MNIRNSFSIVFLIISSFVVNINGQIEDISLIDVFGRLERVQLNYLFNNLKNVLSTGMIRKIQDYQNRISSRRMRERQTVLYKLFQDEKKVDEMQFLIEMVNSLISPLTGKFNTTNYEQIARSIPNQMDAMFESFTDDTKNEFLRLRVTPKEWMIIAIILFDDFDTLLSDVEKTFNNFAYSTSDKLLLRRLFEYFIDIISDKFATLTRRKLNTHLQNHNYQSPSTLPTYEKQIGDEESSQSKDDWNEDLLQGKAKKEDFQKVARKGLQLLEEIDRYNNTRKSLFSSGKKKVHQSSWSKIKSSIKFFVNIFHSARDVIRFLLKIGRFIKNIFVKPTSIVGDFLNIFKSVPQILNPFHTFGVLSNIILDPIGQIFSSPAEVPEVKEKHLGIMKKVLGKVTHLSNKIVDKIFRSADSREINVNRNTNININGIIQRTAEQAGQTAGNVLRGARDNIAEPIHGMINTAAEVVTAPVRQIFDFLG